MTGCCSGLTGNQNWKEEGRGLLSLALSHSNALREAGGFIHEAFRIRLRRAEQAERRIEAERLQHSGNAADRNAAVSFLNFGERVERNPGAFGDDSLGKSPAKARIAEVGAEGADVFLD